MICRSYYHQTNNLKYIRFKNKQKREYEKCARYDSVQ